MFCVNTLAANEEGIANVFAGRTGLYAADRFNHGEWGILETGAPALASAIAVVDCRVIEMKSVATHDVYFGSVAAIRLGATPKALVYHARVYKEV